MKRKDKYCLACKKTLKEKEKMKMSVQVSVLFPEKRDELTFSDLCFKRIN